MNRLIKGNHMVKLFIGLAVGTLFTAFTFVKDDLFEIGKNLEVFSALYRQVSLSYVDDVNPNQLIKKGINAMLEELDPYTEFIPESELAEFRLRYVDTKYAGLGARIVAREDKRIQVAELFEGYPAHKAGLEVGDEILHIDGVSVRGMDAADVSRLLKGEEGEVVELLVRKSIEGKEEAIRVIRQNITQPNVSYSVSLAGNIGYIKLDKFLTGAAGEVRKAILDMNRTAPLEGLVLDLRDNGGGILQESVKILNLFVQQGQEVVSQQGRHEDNKGFRYLTKQAPLAPDLPLVVLINERSASASEIVAGALQDLDRAVIIGNRSFGKGLVQQTYRLPYNNMVKVTVAKYYTPSGRCIQAVDYSHKDANGKAVRINDSLMAEFSTRNGRKVFSGNGVFPDIEINEVKRSAIIRALRSKFLISDYATRYFHEHRSLKDLSSFHLSDEDYNDFLHYLSTHHFAYSSPSEKALRNLGSALEEEGRDGEAADILKLLNEKISAFKDKELRLYKDDIKAQLEEEIASRHYFQKGRYRVALARDEAVEKAKHILTAEKKLAYHDVLAGKGSYHIIGKPKLHLASADELE